MGYYTSFELKLIPEDEQVWEEIGDDDNLSYALVDGCECKWYTHESDMKEFSKRFLDTVFQLSGSGEEAGDLWVKYFKNGKMQKCYARIEFDEYDEGKLK